MSSESENDDFLSADEGDDQELDTDSLSEDKQTSVIEVKIKPQNENNVEKETKSKNEHKNRKEEKNDPDKEHCFTEEVSHLSEQIEKVTMKEISDSKTSESEVTKEQIESVLSEKNSCQDQTSAQITDTKKQNSETEFKEIENTLVKDKKTDDKPVKEAKIGMKKPRERLGERLGNKKLGSRITKPLVGISSDSVINQDVSKEENPKSDLKSSCEDSIKSATDDFKIDNEASETSEASWGSWGDWGMSLASSLSKEVTRGVGTVLETVESSIGAPDPEVLAKEIVEKEKKALEEQKAEVEQIESEPTYSFGFGALGSLVSGVSGALETASNTVLLGGLDTLEKIGRKTMDIIQDGDPGLRQKRAFLTSNKQNLAMVLREARERAIEEEESRRSSFRVGISEEKKKSSISIALLWDNTEGPAHSEALSLVAKQCQEQTNVLLNEISSVWLTKLQEKIAKMKVCSCINEDGKIDDITSSKLMELTRDFPLPLQFNKVITGWPALQQSLSRLSIEICGLGNTDLVDIQKDLYKEVTLYVSNVVGVLHKAAEVSLITPEFDRLLMTQQFQRLCSCISGGLEKCADDICESISKSISAFDPEFNETITNIYLQMAEANLFMETGLMDMITTVVYSEVKSHHDHL